MYVNACTPRPGEALPLFASKINWLAMEAFSTYGQRLKVQMLHCWNWATFSATLSWTRCTNIGFRTTYWGCPSSQQDVFIFKHCRVFSGACDVCCSSLGTYQPSCILHFFLCPLCHFRWSPQNAENTGVMNTVWQMGFPDLFWIIWLPCTWLQPITQGPHKAWPLSWTLWRTDIPPSLPGPGHVRLQQSYK